MINRLLDWTARLPLAVKIGAGIVAVPLAGFIGLFVWTAILAATGIVPLSSDQPAAAVSTPIPTLAPTPTPTPVSTPTQTPVPTPTPTATPTATPVPTATPTAVPTPAPPAARTPTATCRDGSVSYSTSHSGACSHHGGVAKWGV